NFDWTRSSPPPGVGGHNFSVRWTGQVEPPASGTWTFSTLSDDGVRLWVGGRRLIDDWNDHPAREDHGSLALLAGRRYDITVEYYENSYGPAVAKLFWAGPGRPEEIVPRSQLYPFRAAQLAGSVSAGAAAEGVAGVTVTL